MSYLLGQGKDLRLAKTLQAQGHAVRAASAEFGDTSQDYGLFTLFGMPARVEDTQALSDGLFGALQRLATEGPTPDALQQAKSAQVMRHVFDRDEQMSLAISIGRALSAGQSAAEVAQEAARFEAVDAEMIRQTAARWLLREPNMTAHLRPQH
jgi:zinc protease